MWNSHGEFASKIAHNWPRKLNDPTDTPTPNMLYRSLLAAADDNSIKIISIGFLTNLADLIRSTADDSSLEDGIDLITTKVKELIIMGEEYPFGWEFNFGGVDPESSAYVLQHWPKSIPVTFSGVELGRNIFTGQQLRALCPPDSPVLAAYEWYVGRCSTIRESWDPITVLYGILGFDGLLHMGTETLLKYGNEGGYNTITSVNGSNAWKMDSTITKQHWLELADGVTNSSIAYILDKFFTHDSKTSSCPESFLNLPQNQYYSTVYL